MSDYRQAVKLLSKEERIVVAHLEELIGELKSVRVATVFKGQEAVIASAIEKEVMAHIMPHFLEEIGKERSKIDLLLTQVNLQLSIWNKKQGELKALIDSFETKLSILGHIQALAKEGKAEIILPEGEE